MTTHSGRKVTVGEENNSPSLTIKKNSERVRYSWNVELATNTAFQCFDQPNKANKTNTNSNQNLNEGTVRDFNCNIPQF